MQTSAQPIFRDIVLVGGGHSHAIVLRQFAMQPMAGVRLTLICTNVHTPYSGMLPGYIAGHYSFDDVHIDLDRLCVMAGARFYKAEAVGIDRANKKVICKDRPAVEYDLLSINIGASPQMRGVSGADRYALPVKPIAQFNARWLALLARYESHAGQALRVAVVGGGAGGVEILLAMQQRMAAAQFHLFTDGASILPTHHPAVQKRLTRLLADRGVTLHTGATVTQVELGQLHAQGDTFEADEIVWALHAGGAAWLGATGLTLDAHGFVLVNDGLQSITDTSIFATGDCASMVSHSLEKAGVFAVRQGGPLAANLRRALVGEALKPYRPQKRHLALIGAGDQCAVASRGWLWGLVTKLGVGGANPSGRLLWQWKNWIDERFMCGFSELQPMREDGRHRAKKVSKNLKMKLAPNELQEASAAAAMRCGGCAAKVGATVLSRALGGLRQAERADVLIGLRAADDAAVVHIPSGKAAVHTVDFFRSFVDDPYTFGRIAANHALGDIFAMGARVQSATAIATLPAGLESKVEATLRDMMTGAIAVLNDAGCALVGGHTGEGKELALGFAVNGLVDIASDNKTLPRIMTKGAMRAGDVLILTKPLGTGVLLAARVLGKARGRWVDAALVSMEQSNQAGAAYLLAHGATACTDVTGFGLLGHLFEMTAASNVSAQINLAVLPLFDGAQDCIGAGVVSSLQSANVRLSRVIQNPESFVDHPRYPLIFDPQTAGGLLASVPAYRVDECVAMLKGLGYTSATAIGCVLPVRSDESSVRLVCES